ncbi:MAG: amino acid permease [Bacteroidales bacterium]|nr:amino acid permease [Bacteroidales bacterium]
MLTSGKLGFWGLTALVFGLMVGVGIYNLPQNMSASARQGAIFISWIITGAGILPLVVLFKYLSDKYPQYNAGLYQYAQAGFGNYAGFNIAWGYWLCTAFSNVAYGVMLNDAFGAFFPSLLNHSWEMVLFCSALIWLMYWIVSRGISIAKFINNLLALIKVLMLLLIIGVFILYFRLDLFEIDQWGELTACGGVWQQVRSTMMITLFCFFGVEGAVMMSARARNKSDVGKAGFAGFFIALLLYMAVSLLCFGLMTASQLADLNNPSIAYIMKDAVGEWAYWFVIFAVIISLIGGWVAWTLIVAQVPYEASLVGILPKNFARLNHRSMPAYGLIASSIVMELFLLMVVMADDIYLAALRITGLMIIPCYFFTGLFLLKQPCKPKIKIVALLATLFCLWMAYAGGLIDFIMTSPFYLVGIIFFIKVRKESRSQVIFTKNEKWGIALLSAGSLFAIYQSIYLF